MTQDNDLFKKTNRMRQHKSMTNLGSGKRDEYNSFSSGEDTAGSDNVIKPYISKKKVAKNQL